MLIVQMRSLRLDPPSTPLLLSVLFAYTPRLSTRLLNS